MYSGLDRRVHFSQEDLAMGAVDLSEIEEEEKGVNNAVTALANSTMQAAVAVVKEAGPKILETIVNHLVPVLPSLPQSALNPSTPPPAVSVLQPPTYFPLPEVLVSSPVETIIVMPPVSNISHPVHPIIPITHDTVRLIVLVLVV
jgi:hypothetical protein